jgi:hypothetical protein
MKKGAMKRIFFTVNVFLAFIFVVQACSIERRLGKRILQSPDSLNVCIINPVALFKENLKTWEIPDYDSLPENVRDSALFYNSRFLQHVNDSLFLALYEWNVRKILKTYGINVFSADSMHAFLKTGGNSYMFTIAQVMLEEYMEPDSRSLSVANDEYYYEIWLNAVALNIWYEARALNYPDSKMEVLYANMYVRDKVTGPFWGGPLKTETGYVYRADTIQVNSVYNLALRAASTHAQYIFDYIVNDRISRKAKPGGPRPAYMHYDTQKKKLVKAGQRRFVRMDAGS